MDYLAKRTGQYVITSTNHPSPFISAISSQEYLLYQINEGILNQR